MANRCLKKGGKKRKGKLRQRKGYGKGRKRRGRKRPLPAFFLFMKDKRSKLKCDNPNWDVIQMAKRLGSMWHQQPNNDKENYKRKAAQLWQTYSGCRGRRNSKKKRKKRKIGQRRCRDLKNRKTRRRRRKAKEKKPSKCKCQDLLKDLESLSC